MRKISDSKQMEGLELVNPNNSKTRYLASKKFVMVEFDVDDGKEYVSLYLRPYDNNKTLITAYLPELEYLEDIKLFNKVGLLKFLSRSEKFSEIYKSTSTISNKPFLSKVHDFTETDRNVELMCIQKIINLQLTPKIINEEYPEYETFENGVNELIAVVVEYLKIYQEHLRDTSYTYWVGNVNSSRVKAVIKKCEEEGFWGSFINKTDNLADSSVRNLIKEYKVAMMCENMIYPIGNSIEEEDKQHDAIVIILAEVFEPSLKDSGYFFCIDLEYNYGSWRPKANLGELIECISIILNHVNSKKWVKIDETAYKHMPQTTELWYYSNPYHEGTMLHRFMRDGDQTDYGVDEPFIKVEEPTFIKSGIWGSVKCNNPWNDVQSFNYVSSIIEEALIVIYEFQRYYPIWKRKQITGTVGEVGKALINPYKYVFKKILGMD